MSEKSQESIMKELQKSAFKIDLVPKTFIIGGKFMMNGMLYLHLGNQKCLLVAYEGEEIILPSA